MRLTTRFFLAFLFASATVAVAPAAYAVDVDGPDDCVRAFDDWGDAPECLPAYPSGQIGNFPTCLQPCGVGNVQAACPPISIPPGPTGYVKHVNLPNGYWLGCYPVMPGWMGVDNDIDGKVSLGMGPSACHSGLFTDCLEPAWGGMAFGQDECYTDGSDAGITAPMVFANCQLSTVAFNTTLCPGHTGDPVKFLNVCVDWNADGDWNDNFLCPAGCAYEWALVNVPILLNPGCMLHVSPPFLSGPFAGPAWLRITISDQPVPNDYPWNGTVSMPGEFVHGGETEDYPVVVNDATPARPSTWGSVKILYR